MYPLIIPFIFSLATIFYVVVIWKRQIKNSPKKKYWISFMVFITLFFIIISSGLVENIAYNNYLKEFELNQNGIFENNELNIQQKELRNSSLIKPDSNFVIFTAALVSSITSFIAFFIFLLFDVGKLDLNIGLEKSIIKVRILDSINCPNGFSLYKLSYRDSIILEKEYFRFKNRGLELNSQNLLEIASYFPSGFNVEPWIRIKYENMSKTKEIYINTRMKSMFGGNEILEKELNSRYFKEKNPARAKDI